MPKPVVLAILDGWGLSGETEGNAVYHANTPNLDKIIKNCPHSQLLCSGENVGLPVGQQGNSEVGHLNLGAGRIIYQDLMRINQAIQEGTFKSNKTLQTMMERCHREGTSLHLMGLLSDGGVHSHQDHLFELLHMAKDVGLEKVWVHCFLDGRDVPPQSAGTYIRELENNLADIGIGEIATVSGRYYAMDRDRRMDRVEKTWQAMVYGRGEYASNAQEALDKEYENGRSDEFVLPHVMIDAKGNPKGKIEQADAVFFFNFRADRARELVEALVIPDFNAFDRQGHYVSHMGTMTEYDINLNNFVEVAFPPMSHVNTLGEWLAKHGKHQLRIAETEKYAHVTFFFNGGIEKENENEERILIPSPKVATYDLQPEMHADQVADVVVKALQEETYDFILVNFANPDMVGHTGVFRAAIQAMENVDNSIGRIINEIEKHDAALFICADHGNCEHMIANDGTPYTAHTVNPVPFILYDKSTQHHLKDGRLCDVAPSILDLMKLPIPKEMTGKSLLN